MFSLCHRVALAVGLVLAAGVARAWAAPLRVCADPDDLPFSNRAGQGFENQIAIQLGRELGRKTEFVWARSRKGFLREEFNKNACDVLLGVPRGMKGVLTSEPYYVSSYVFVTAAREHLQITRFDDPRLNGRRIGLQILEDDLSPPSLPLIRYGHASQLVGFDSFGNAASEIVRAVADGKVGAAVVWGPIAGYYANRLHLPVVLSAVSPQVDPATHIPFTFAMTAAVHKNDGQLLQALNAAIAKDREGIGRILAGYDVPISADGAPGSPGGVVKASASAAVERPQKGAL